MNNLLTLPWKSLKIFYTYNTNIKVLNGIQILLRAGVPVRIPFPIYDQPILDVWVTGWITSRQGESAVINNGQYTGHDTVRFFALVVP